MCFWDTIHFAGMGLQIAAVLGGGISLSWLRVGDGHVYFSPERLHLVKRFSLVLLWMLAIGFILVLWYEIHLLQVS